MNKNIFYYVGMALVAIVVAVLWLLSIVAPATFQFFTLAWAGTILSGGCAVILTLKAIFSKTAIILKKITVACAVILAVLCVVGLVFAITLPQNIIFPIIAIVVTVGLLVSVLVVGGKKWDSGDNQNIGYKTYNERKEEENAKNSDKDN